MPFEKGKSGNPKGRNKGAENKVTTEIKEAYKMLIEANIPNLTLWLERVAKDNPEAALKYLASLSEYVVPKLARTEIDGKIQTAIIKFKDAE